jgi:predicted RNase H-like nuclease (RuvC/YqgF family)
MESIRVKDRASSLVNLPDLQKATSCYSSPEIRPAEASEIPPPMSLCPSALQNDKQVKELLAEREQDQHLISLLKKHCFKQSKEIEKLKNKLENLQKNYEILIENSKNNQNSRKYSIIETAILARSRSDSLSNF